MGSPLKRLRIYPVLLFPWWPSLLNHPPLDRQLPSPHEYIARMCLIPFLSLKMKCHFLFLLCFPFLTDGVFGRCQKVPAIDIYRYEVSPVGLQHLTATLQKLSRTGRQAWAKTVSWDRASGQWPKQRFLEAAMHRAPLRHQWAS
uniref:Uncharacterized protein n=1 Tax=Ursus maritimus TaxID=29073 RepID=A0A452UDK8_URSMA